MSGTKGFSIIITAILLLAFLFIGIGRGQDMTEEEFEKQYKESIEHQINMPLDIVSRIHIEGEKIKTFETLRHPYFLVDIFKSGAFSLFFGYVDQKMDKLTISKVIANGNIELASIQYDDTFEHREKNQSYVVFGLLPEITPTGRSIDIEVFFEPNNQNITKKTFTIDTLEIDKIFKEVEKYYKAREVLKRPKMKV